MIAEKSLPRLLTAATFVLFATSLIAALFFKDNRLWMDEILSYFFITDPSITHVNRAVVSGIEQTPPLFFNLYWLIGHGISLSVAFLKSVSILLFATTMALFYRYTTRLVGTPILNFVLITGIAAFTYLNITLAIQIRSYVLFLLITFLYVTIVHRLIQRPDNKALLATHVGMGLLLILSHNFGLFYLATAGAFFGVLWLWSRDGRYWFVLGSFGVIGATWLLTWYPFFAMQAKTGELHSWIPLPTWRSFFRTVGDLAPTISNKVEEATGPVPLLAIVRFIGVLALFSYVALPRLRRGFRAVVADPAFTFYLLAGFFYVVPITITLVMTFVHTSLFISRYLWPTHLLVIYQLLYAVYALLNRPAVSTSAVSTSAASTGAVSTSAVSTSAVSTGAVSTGAVSTGAVSTSAVSTGATQRLSYRWPQAGLVVVYALAVGSFLFYQTRKLTLTPVDVMAYVDKLDRKAPVFLESSINFLPIWYYNRDRPIHFLLDHESAFNPDNDPGATVGYYTLSGVKNQFGVDAVLPVGAFTRQQFPHFFVVDERWNYQIERFIQNKSVRVLRRIPTTLDGFTILECMFTGETITPNGHLIRSTHEPNT